MLISPFYHYIFSPIAQHTGKKAQPVSTPYQASHRRQEKTSPLFCTSFLLSLSHLIKRAGPGRSGPALFYHLTLTSIGVLHCLDKMELNVCSRFFLFFITSSSVAGANRTVTFAFPLSPKSTYDTSPSFGYPGGGLCKFFLSRSRSDSDSAKCNTPFYAYVPGGLSYVTAALSK